MRYDVRLATLDDARKLYAWRTDPVSMASMHHGEPFTFESHCAWLERSLTMPTRRLYIVSQGSQDVGTVRTDKEGAHTSMSWTVAPECRGCGHGKGIVAAVLAVLDGVVHAEIKAANVASRKVAEQVGFTLDRDEKGVLHYFYDTTRGP